MSSPKPTTNTAININDVKYELLNWSNPDLHENLLRQCHKICCLEFNESEMEKYSVWEYLIRSQDPKWPYRMSLTAAYYYEENKESNINDNCEGEDKEEKGKTQPSSSLIVLGVVDHEYYPNSNTGLMPYVVVAEKARGLGLCSRLVSKGYEALNKIAQSPPYNQQQGIFELFIELSQKSDAKDDGNPYHSVEAAITRHKIWERVGFLGVDFSFYHPGYLKNTLHQLTVYRPEGNSSSNNKSKDDESLKRKRPVSVKVIDSFFRDMFRGILLQENQEDIAEAEADKALAQVKHKDQEFVNICEWK